MRRVALLSVLATLLAIPALVVARNGNAPVVSEEAARTYRDIEATLGMVPSFLRMFPENAIAGAWEQMKAVQLNPNSAIPAKYKELIGLGVAAQVPCRYCAYFHTEAARLNGASDEEIKEAVAQAAITRHWATYFNGMKTDPSTFRNDVELISQNLRARRGDRAPPRNIEVTDTASAYRDIEQSFGFLPAFIKEFPKEALPGAWKELKAVEFNPEGAVPGRYRSLISLAVAAQVPCNYCVEIDTVMATRVEGASTREIEEAVMMAAIVRHWSTYLNGLQVDETRFKRETDQLMKILRQKKAAKSAMVP
ncbi:MAG: carboxymuconolactone decarboxylase family protein [Myxococcota bacterium]